MRPPTGVRWLPLPGLLIASASLLLISTPSVAFAEDFAGVNVAEIRVQPEPHPLLPVELNDAFEGIPLGQPLDPAAIRRAIELLFKSGRYENIAVDAARDARGVVLTFITEPASFIRNVSVEGVPEPPNQGVLVSSTKLQLGTRFAPSETKQATENLLEVLRTNGFYLAKVFPEKIAVPIAQQVDLSFRVEAGDRAEFDLPLIRGNPGVPPEQLIKATRWKRWLGLLGWKTVSEARVQQGLDRIRRSYQKRDYLMAKVGLDLMEFRENTNTLVPVVSVESGPKVRIRTKGARMSKGKLREFVPIYQEQAVDRDLLVEGKRNLTEYFESRGFFEAEVDFELIENGQERIVEYSFAPGERHKLVLLEIAGNRYFDTRTLRERMYITPATRLRFRRGRYGTSFLKRDVASIEDLYRANGFRNVEVTARAEDDYANKLNELAVFIDVKEGQQSFVNRLELSGVSEANQEAVLSMLSSLEGQPYSDLNVLTDQENVLNYYFNRGYADATFEVASTPAAQDRVDLKIVVFEGKQQFVRKVLVSGLDSSDPDLVYSRITLEDGEPLSQSSMIESQRRLYDLGIFARVETALQNPDGDEQHKYVLYNFEEGRRYSITAGFGAQFGRIGRGTLSTFDSPAGSAGFSPRISLGVSRSNFLGIGHTINLQTRLSNVQRRGVLSYIAPQFKGNDDLSLSFTALYDDARDIRTFSSKRLEGSVQLAQRLSKANTLQYRLTARRVTVGGLATGFIPQLIPLLSQPIQLGVASATFLQDRRDDPSDARKGVFNSVDFAFASDIFGSREAFTRVLARNATFHRIGKDLVFARSINFGAMSRLTDADVPLPERFFAGGASSHRGFPDNQAGPRDSPEFPQPGAFSSGFPLGGKALLFNSLELRFPLIGDNLSGVLFHDAGNVYSSLNDISFRSRQRENDLSDFDYMVHAVGFGLRYRTPIGPVRLDLAYNANPPRFFGLKGTVEDFLNGSTVSQVQRLSRLQFHFSLGQAF